MECIIYVGNSTLMELRGLKNGITNSYENGAAVEVTLKDESEVDILGEFWPKSLGYVADSDGDYQATISEALQISHGQVVTAVITAIASGLTAKWEAPCKAIERT